VVVAWNMSELDHFIQILKTEKGDAAILLVTFGLTILIDLTVAVEVGVLLGAVIFMKRMSDASHLQVYRKITGENINEETELSDTEAIYKKEIPTGVKVFELEGPLFFGASDLFDEAIRLYEASDKVFILRLRKMMLIDASGLHALEMFKSNCHKRGVTLVFSEIQEQIKKPLIKVGIIERHGEDRAFRHIDEAIEFARKNSIS
jgi:SulP family sulfate permease